MYRTMSSCSASGVLTLACKRAIRSSKRAPLWAEQPLAPQFDFVFRIWGAEVHADPSLAEEQPYKALATHDLSFFGGVATQDPDTLATLLRAFARSWKGTTPAEFDAQVRDWLKTVKQPKFDVSYLELVYQPMIELIEYLKANGFRVFVCSGGGRDFMRVFAEETWGIPKENVIGTAAEYHYVDGAIVRGDQALGGLNIGAGKVEHIFAQTDRLPAFAGGNADIDIEMLESAPFSLLVVHDDEDREFGYTAGAEKSVEKAGELGWTIVSVKSDWKTVFPERRGSGAVAGGA